MKKQSGIDIDLGNQSSKIAFSWAKKTFESRRNRIGYPAFPVDGGFANILDFDGKRIGISSDGIGTKIELAERIGIYHTLGFDLVAMVVDDLVATGVEPVSISNILDVDYLDSDIVNELMRGLHDAAIEARVLVSGGEIAELGTRIGGYGQRMHFNWCASGIGILPAGIHLIDGTAISPGDRIISLRSCGLRSNGFSKIRSIMESHLGDSWHAEIYENGITWAELLLTPSRIYAPVIVDILRAGISLHGIAHITGGGIGDNLSRILRPAGAGANLDGLFPPHGFLKHIQEIGDVSEREAYTLWNMGNGMLLVLSPEDETRVLHHCRQNGLEAKTAGIITEEARIVLATAGMEPQQLIYSIEGVS